MLYFCILQNVKILVKNLKTLATLSFLIAFWSCEKPEVQKEIKFRVSKIVVYNTPDSDSVVVKFTYFADSMVIEEKYADNGTERQILTYDGNNELASVKYFSTVDNLYEGERILSRKGSVVYLIEKYAEKNMISDTAMAFHLDAEGYAYQCDLFTDNGVSDPDIYELSWTDGNLTGIDVKGLTGNYNYDDSPNLLCITKLPVYLNDDMPTYGFSLFNRNNFNDYSFFGETVIKSSNIKHDTNGLLTEKTIYYAYSDLSMNYRYEYEQY